MSNIKVGIVEDEMIIALGISETIREIGYDVTEVATSYTEALQMIANEKPDILLLDIQLSGRRDGIHVAEVVRKEYKIPIIFLTANADPETVERAKKVYPNAYLGKPFRKNDLFTSIELCLHHFSQTGKDNQEKATPSVGNYMIQDSLFIKQGQYFHKVKMQDILYLESDNVYIFVHTLKSKMMVRSTLTDYIELLGQGHFFRVHRSFVVNANHIDSINSEYLIVNEKQIPISKSYRDQLLQHLKLG